MRNLFITSNSGISSSGLLWKRRSSTTLICDQQGRWRVATKENSYRTDQLKYNYTDTLLL